MQINGRARREKTEKRSIDQAVVEEGAIFGRNLSDCHFWVALLLVITNRDGKQGSLGGWGIYWGSKSEGI